MKRIKRKEIKKKQWEERLKINNETAEEYIAEKIEAIYRQLKKYIIDLNNWPGGDLMLKWVKSDAHYLEEADRLLVPHKEKIQKILKEKYKLNFFEGGQNEAK